MEELWKMFPEFEHCVKPPFKVLSIPAAKYWSPEGPELYSLLIDYVDSLCSVWMSCLCRDTRQWQESHLFMVTRGVAVNFKSGLFVAMGELQIWSDSGQMADGKNSVYIDLTILYRPKWTKASILQLLRTHSRFPTLSNAGVDASLRRKTGLGSKVNCTVTLWWVLRP